VLKFGVILNFFCIFSELFRLVEFFLHTSNLNRRCMK
jgi:hypothetical protein